MSNPFKRVDLIRPSIFHRLFKIQIKLNALHEINNLLASVPEIAKVTTEDIDKILCSYNKSIKKFLLPKFEMLYATLLRHCLKDNKIDENENKDLSHLLKSFGISKRQADRIYIGVVKDIDEKNLDEIIKDGTVSDEGKRF